MGGYYEELQGALENAHADGWRGRLEQWLRFEAVIRGLAIQPDQSVLDLGCGTGELQVYLGEGHRGGYLGVDQQGPSIERARRRGSPAQFLVQDFFRAEVGETGRFDWAVAIGALVDGAAGKGAAERQRALTRLVRKLDELGTLGWALVVLNQDELERDLVRSLEPCLRGATVEELNQAVKACGERAWIDDSLMPTDLFVVVSRGEDPRVIGDRLHGIHCHQEVLRRANECWGPKPEEIVRFWLNSGRVELARQTFEEVPGCYRGRSILKQRLRALSRG